MVQIKCKRTCFFAEMQPIFACLCAKIVIFEDSSLYLHQIFTIHYEENSIINGDNAQYYDGLCRKEQKESATAA